jgi:hypothetical protein
MKHGVTRDARIIDQYLDRTEFVLDVDDALLAGGIIADILLEDEDLVLVAEGLSRLIIAMIVGSNVVAGRLQSFAGRGADAARSARDQSHPCHESSLHPVSEDAKTTEHALNRAAPPKM